MDKREMGISDTYRLLGNFRLYPYFIKKNIRTGQKQIQAKELT